MRLWALHETEPFITLVHEEPMPGIQRVVAHADRLMAFMRSRVGVFALRERYSVIFASALPRSKHGSPVLATWVTLMTKSPSRSIPSI